MFTSEVHACGATSEVELVVARGPAAVWQKLIDAQRWPDRYANAHNVRIADGPMLADGTVFRWTEETQVGPVPYVARAWMRRGLLKWHQHWLEGLDR